MVYCFGAAWGTESRRPSFRALGEPGTRRVPVREPCDPESTPPSSQPERWIPDSAVAGFLRNPGQTGFRNDNWGIATMPYAIALPRTSAPLAPIHGAGQCGCT